MSQVAASTEFSEKVLVLKVGRFREADLWVRFVSPSRGVLTGFAFGGCKSRRRFCGCLDTFNEVLINAKASRSGGYLSLEEGVLVNSPQGLRKDCGRMGVAVNCVKFFEAVEQGLDRRREAYELLAGAIRYLDGAESAPVHFPLLFRGRLLFELGYAPNLEACSLCGRDLASDGGYLLVEHGRMACGGCAPRAGGARLYLGREAVSLLARLRDTGPAEWSGLHLLPEVRKEMAAALDHFIGFHLGLVWDRGGFRRI